MSERDDGGPAFPAAYETVAGRPSYIKSLTAGGMSLRDYFAAKAMQAIVTAYMSPETAVKADLEALCPVAYLVADCMLKARKA